MPSTSNLPTDFALIGNESPARARTGQNAEASACSNCQTLLVGRFFHACGQDSVPPETAWQSWIEQWQRLLRTLRTLVFEPGRIAQQHLAGARVRYIPPLTFWISVNLTLWTV